MNKEITEQLRIVYLTGGTGVLKTKQKEVRILASSIMLDNAWCYAKTEVSENIIIPIKDIISAHPA
jgi:hypothetical protein